MPDLKSAPKPRVVLITRKASFWKRLAAYFIDYIVVALFISALELMFLGSLSITNSAGFGTLIIYQIIAESIFGRTIGKRAMSLMIFKVNGKSPDLLSNVSRNLGKLISAIPYYYGFVRILAPHVRQTIHDEIARCLVVEVVGRKMLNHNPPNPQKV
jgi:uncharacterized RDD family membrane protein YckC